MRLRTRYAKPSIPSQCNKFSMCGSHGWGIYTETIDDGRSVIHLSATPTCPSPPEDLTNSIVKINSQSTVGGSFADVYECSYRSSSGPGTKKVAVKVFRVRLQVDDKNDMIRRELGIWRRLNHPNIVPFLGITSGFGTHDSMSLVTLWMPNGTLQKLLRTYESLEVSHRLQLLLDIASGLDYLHSLSPCMTVTSFHPNPVVHGDLNPSNVLLDENYTARLADFGNASIIGKIPEALSYLSMPTDRPGTLRWAAPECLVSESGLRTTARDVYSFGCIARQVLSGEQPWADMRYDAVVVLHLSRGEILGRPTSRPIDDRHWEFIERCLLSMPERRPTANVIVSSIRQFLDDVPSSRPLREAIASWSSVVADGEELSGLAEQEHALRL